ncbi:MAG: TetR/AcrR family transcriptional regulator [Verrucomicrobiota bacterium]
MPANLQDESPRERILQTAADLFYRNGYRATGTNEIIDKANVAKATFYAHFPTKDDLCLAYLKDRNAREAEEIMTFVNSKRSPLTRFYAVMDSMEPWAINTQYRGCQFINMVPEVPDHTHELRKEGHRHYDWARNLVHQLAQKLIDSDPKKYKHLNADDLTESYMTHLAGAIALAGVYNKLGPIKSGMKAVRRLVSD